MASCELTPDKNIDRRRKAGGCIARQLLSTVAQPTDNPVIIRRASLHFLNKKANICLTPKALVPFAPNNISPIIKFQMKEDLSAEARSEGCRSPRRDAAFALLIGRRSWPMK